MLSASVSLRVCGCLMSCSPPSPATTTVFGAVPPANGSVTYNGTISGLANNQLYSVTVLARNADQFATGSAAVPVTPCALADAPTAVSVSSGYAALSITWTAPTNGNTRRFCPRLAQIRTVPNMPPPTCAHSSKDHFHLPTLSFLACFAVASFCSVRDYIVEVFDIDSGADDMTTNTTGSTTSIHIDGLGDDKAYQARAAAV